MRLKRLLASAVLLVFAFGVVGCALFQKNAAVVNGEGIPMSKVDDELNKIAAQHKTAEQKKIFQQQKKEIQKTILDDLINKKLYEQEAEKMNIEVTDKEVDKEIESTKKRFPSESAFNKALKDANFTMDDLKEFIKNSLLTKRVNEKVTGKITITDKEVKDYFDKNSTQFKDPEQVKVSHILVKTEDEAKSIKSEIDSGAITFEDAAKKYSTDPGTKDKGGDLGFVQKGQMAPEFETAAFGLAIGVISDPVKTQFGYHLIKVFEKKEARQKTFDEVKSSIEQMLKAQKESDKVKKWLDGIKKKSTIKKNI